MPTPPGWEPVGKPPGWEPAEAATSPAPAPESSVTRFYKQYLAKPLTSAVSKGISAGGTALRALDPGEWPGLLRGQGGPSPVADMAAEFAVPQTPTQALTMAATGGAGKLASGLSRPLQALSRVTGGLIGNEAGNAVEGRGAGTGALATGGVLGAVEAAAPVLGKVMRSLPGAKGRIAADDAAGFGQTMGQVSPPLAGARTVEELRGLAQGPGQEALGAAKDVANKGITASLKTAGHDLIEVPSLGGPSGTNMLTLQDANDALSQIGARAFSKNPLERTVQGIDQRQLYGQVRQDILSALTKADPSGGLASQFEAAQNAYKGGLSLTRMLQSPNAYRNLSEGAQFNTPYFQQQIANPKVAAGLRNKLGDQQFEALVQTLTRGGGQGTKDVLASGGGHMADAFMQSFGRGTNTGATQYLGVPLRTALPNLGSQYAGRAPLSPGSGTMTTADLAALRALGVLPGSQP